MPRPADQPLRLTVLALSRPLPAPSLAALEQFVPPPGIALQIDPSCRGTDWFADDDRSRAARFLAAWRNPEIDAIWVARGGYGHARMLDHLDPADFMNGGDLGKPVIGYSDVTALHLFLYRYARNRLIHGPMPVDLGPEGAGSLTDDIAALFTTLHVGRAESEALALEVLRPGWATGPILAANMTLLLHSLGTQWQPDLRGHVLVLEDVGEAPYRLDRMFVQLRQAGLLRDLAALVLGEFTPPTDRAGADFPASVAEMALAAVACPVVQGMPLGHGARNLPVEQGAPACLSASGVLRWSACPV